MLLFFNQLLMRGNIVQEDLKVWPNN